MTWRPLRWSITTPAAWPPRSRFAQRRSFPRCTRKTPSEVRAEFPDCFVYLSCNSMQVRTISAVRSFRGPIGKRWNRYSPAQAGSFNIPGLDRNRGQPIPTSRGGRPQYTTLLLLLVPGLRMQSCIPHTSCVPHLQRTPERLRQSRRVPTHPAPDSLH